MDICWDIHRAEVWVGVVRLSFEIVWSILCVSKSTRYVLDLVGFD